MATVVSKSLQLETSNVEQYCSADGLSLNAGGYAIRKWLNGSTSGYATLNDAAKNVLYPTATSHPFKVDSEIRGSRSAGSMTVNLEFGGTVVHSESFTSTSLSTRTKPDITDSVVTNSSRDTQIRWNVRGANANNQRVAHVKLVLYFNQYTMSANKGTGANGIQSASVSDSAPYEGDTVTFTPKLVNGATWDGWYSDAACTQLVSTEQNYTTSAADLTLYAKATIDAVVYNCSAVAGENIASASVSDESVVSGDSVTFTAQLNEGCLFDGWYSDSSYSTLVSTSNPYTTTITSDTTLYAKGTKISYSVSVGTAEHGTAAVSTNTAYYGDSVTFTFTPENETWELWGWYSDKGLTQLVSESNPYTHSVTGDIALYPKIGIKRYTAKIRYISRLLSGASITGTVKIAALQYGQLTKLEHRLLKIGDFEQIDQSKIIAINSHSSNTEINELSASIKVPMNSMIAIWAETESIYDDGSTSVLYIADKNYINTTNYISNLVVPYNYYTFILQEDTEYRVGYSNIACHCSAVAMDGIEYAGVITPTLQGYNAVFEADLIAGYEFAGWYSDEACTQLVSTDNPAQVTTPSTGDLATQTSLTLYAKATKKASSTGIYIKSNGTFVEANAVYKKVNGAWVSDVDSCKTLLSSTERVGTIVKRL